MLTHPRAVLEHVPGNQGLLCSSYSAPFQADPGEEQTKPRDGSRLAQSHIAGSLSCTLSYWPHTVLKESRIRLEVHKLYLE